MKDKVESNVSGTTEEQSVNPSEQLEGVYQPPSGEETPTEEPGNNQEVQEAVTENKEDKPVLTEERISELIAEKVEQGIASGLRKFQSMGDKREQRLKGMIAENEKRISKILGRDLNEQEKVALEGELREQVRNTEEDVDETNAQGQDTFEPSPEAKREIANKVQALEIKYETRLYEEDEEAKTVNWNERDHLKLLKQIESAIKAKSGKSLSDDSVAGATGRLPAGQNQQKPSALKGKTPGQLLEEAFPRKG